MPIVNKIICDKCNKEEPIYDHSGDIPDGFYEIVGYVFCSTCFDKIMKDFKHFFINL